MKRDSVELDIVSGGGLVMVGAKAADVRSASQTCNIYIDVASMPRTVDGAPKYASF